MVAPTARRKTRDARHAARRAAGSRYVMLLARGGFTARGIMYAIIGVLALEVVFGNSGQQADQSGAVRALAATPFGAVLLWLLVAGFTGMVLWRLLEALHGGRGDRGQKAGTRLAASGKSVLYGFVAFGIMKYALGLGAPASSNKQAVDLTATAMGHPGGRILVAIAGLAFIAAGAVLAYLAWKQRFLSELELGQAGPRVRSAVVALGRIGGIARGMLFAAAGAFLMTAAVTARAGQAKGLDATLRAFTQAPAGPWLLVLVAVGLVVFGIYSFAEARWCRP